MKERSRLSRPQLHLQIPSETMTLFAKVLGLQPHHALVCLQTLSVQHNTHQSIFRLWTFNLM